jgi:signal peptidase I
LAPPPQPAIPMRLLVRSATAAIAALTCAAGIGLLTGSLSLVTTFGVSMAPRMVADDLVVVRSSNYGVGDVVAYRSPELRQIVLHRIVATEGDLFVFQGDNNAFLDPERLPASSVIGQELLHIPRGGIWLKRLTSPPALAAYTFLLLAGGAAAATTKRQRHKERRTVSPARHRSTATPTLGRLPQALRPLAATAAAVGLLGVALGGLSWTRPTTTTAPMSSVDSSIDFSYSATVPQTPAYDGTTVVAPQPVFRTLTDTVDVTYAYAGRPGKIAVEAELSTSSGWRSTLKLTDVQPLTAQDEGRVTLDLSALEVRAEAAAAVTGIPAGALTVTVIPKIWMDGGGQFTPRLPLTLDSLTLKPSVEGALSASTSTSTDGTGTAPAQLSALGLTLDVSTARALSLAVLLLASLAGVAIAAVVRMSGPVAEADRIRHRHKDLLLPVLPVALTPGRPVVDVGSVEHLVRLAERYGLLVLYWERSGVTTYVVQDEGTTYRYRNSLPVEVPEPVGV